jgi:predicted DNA-binding transcriptional regulator YafY
MPAKRELTMRQIRYVLRLASEGVSTREIARMLGVARSTIRDNLRRAREAGLSWPLPGDLTDVVLEARLFAYSGGQRGRAGGPSRFGANWSASSSALASI